MPSKRFQDKRCVYCGVPGSHTADHVVPRSFFPADRRQDLPKVPACSECNSEKSKLEHYLASALPLVGRHPDAVPAAEEALRKLEKNRKLRRELACGISLLDGSNDDTLVSSLLTYPFRDDAILSWSKFAVRGLLYWHWDYLLLEDQDIFSCTCDEEATSLLDELFFKSYGWSVAGDIGGGVFIYDVICEANNPAVSSWKIRLYGGVIWCDKDRRFANMIFAQTGRRDFVQKIKAAFSRQPSSAPRPSSA